MKVGLVTATVEDTAGIVEIHRSKERALLALLALTPGRVVSVDRLIDGLWGDEPPRTAAKTLQTYVKNLRGRIADSGAARDTLRTDPPGYLLVVEPDDVDLLHFEAQCQQAAKVITIGELHEGDELYRDALALVAQADFASFGAPGLDGAAVRFAEQRRRAIDEHRDVQLALGRHADLIGPLSASLETDAGNERAWGQLITALYRAGRQRDALRTCETARSRMGDEYGLEPGPALVDLETRILNHDLPAAGTAQAAPGEPVSRPESDGAVALTFTAPAMAPDAAARLVELVVEPAAVVDRSPTALGYRVVVADTQAAVLLANRLRGRVDDLQVAAVREGIPDEQAAITELFALAQPIVFADEVGAPLAQRRWTRVESGWSAPENVLTPLRIPTALEQLRGRTPSYIRRAGDDKVADYHAQLTRGSRQVLRVDGPAGIGKSSWLARAAHEMINAGCAVLHGQARPADTAAHEVFADAAYQAVMMLTRDELEAHVDRHGFALQQLVPEIQSRVGAPALIASPPGSGAEVEAALLDLLQRVARTVPTVLVIDDAPLLADESSQLLARLATDQRSAPMGLIVACRSHDPETPPLAPALADICTGHAVELERFSVDQTARFLESVAGLERSPRTLQVAELVNQATLGLPLFVREIAHDLTQSGDWFTTSGKFRIDRTPDNLELPTSLHQLLRRRLDRLDTEAQLLASIGAVFGEFSTLLVAAVSELPVSDVLGAIDRLVEQRVIDPIAGLADHYQFAHPLLQKAALHDIGSARTASVALAAAEYLSAHSSPTARQLDRRAELWFRALPLAPIERVHAELDAAADAAHVRSDHHQRVLHLKRRVQASESAALDVPVATLVTLAEASAAAQVEAGVRRRRARVAFSNAIDADEPDLAARAALAFAGPFNPFGSLVTVDEEGESMARRALDSGITSVDLRAELWGMVAAAASDVTGAAAELHTALALAEQEAHPLVYGRLLSMAQSLESSANPVIQRIATNWHIIRTGQEHTDRALELQGWGWMVADAFEAADIELMQQAAAKRTGLVERLDDATYRWSDLVYQGMRATIAGQFDDADTTLWQALEVGRLPLGDHANRFFGLQLLKLSEMRGHGDTMLAPARAYAEQLGYLTAYVSLAHLHAELGDIAAAADLIGSHLPADLSELLHTYDRLPTLAMLARIAQRCSNEDLAEQVASKLLPSAGQLCVHADAVLYGSVHHNLGRCALTTGDGPLALNWLDRSEQVYKDLGASAWSLLLEADTCDALDLVGDTEQATRRRATLDRARQQIGRVQRTGS